MPKSKQPPSDKQDKKKEVINSRIAALVERIKGRTPRLDEMAEMKELEPEFPTFPTLSQSESIKRKKKNPYLP